MGSIASRNSQKKQSLYTLENISEYEPCTAQEYASGYTDDEIAALGEGTSWQEAMLRTAMHQSHTLA